MSDLLFSVQKAVFSKLYDALGDATPVYDHVPPEASFPYIVYGPAHIAANDTKTGVGFEHIVTLNIWSQYRGGKETRAIFQKIYDALNRATLALEGQTFVACAFDSADFSMDPDGLTYFAAVRFTLLTESL